MTALLTALFGALCDAFFNSMLTHIPQIVAAIASATTRTMIDATQAPAPLINSLNQEIADANKPH